MRKISWPCVIALAVLSVGCGIPNTVSELSGDYMLHEGAVEISLHLSGDGTYSENVLMADGTKQEARGKWEVVEGHVHFSKLLIPEKLRSYPASTEAKPKDVTELDEGYYVLPAERWFSKIQLVVDPDQDINFVRMGR